MNDMTNERIQITPEFLKEQGFSPTFPTRFWKKVRINENGCWDWIGGLDTCGYGAIAKASYNGKVGAHRASWILNFGVPPKGMEVCHECNRRCCVNPLHLFLGTHKENMHDCMKKGLMTLKNLTHRYPTGVNHPDCKLTDEQVLQIRKIGRSQFYHITAKQFGVGKCVIGQIIRGQRRQNVKEGGEPKLATP